MAAAEKLFLNKTDRMILHDFKLSMAGSSDDSGLDKVSDNCKQFSNVSYTKSAL